MSPASRKDVLRDLVSGSAIRAKFKNRSSAGNILSALVKEITDVYPKNQIVVVGIPRGGLITADRVCTKLGTNSSAIFVKRLVAQWNKEISLGAILPDGTAYLNESLIKSLDVSEEYLIHEILLKKKKVRQLFKLYSKGVKFPKFTGKIIVLIDDGIVTGSTMIAASRWLHRFQPRRLVIASPVCPYPTIKLLRNEADDIAIISTPSTANFKSVDQFYLDFRPVSDKAVMKILQKRRFQNAADN